jgi:hypothetical protein
MITEFSHAVVIGRPGPVAAAGSGGDAFQLAFQGASLGVRQRS